MALAVLGVQAAARRITAWSTSYSRRLRTACTGRSTPLRSRYFRHARHSIRATVSVDLDDVERMWVTDHGEESVLTLLDEDANAILTLTLDDADRDRSVTWLAAQSEAAGNTVTSDDPGYA